MVKLSKVHAFRLFLRPGQVLQDLLADTLWSYVFSGRAPMWHDMVLLTVMTGMRARVSGSRRWLSSVLRTMSGSFWFADCSC